MDGRVADFKIYDYAMTAEQVADEFAIPDDEKVAKDKEWLDLGDLSAVIDNLTLPTKEQQVLTLAGQVQMKMLLQQMVLLQDLQLEMAMRL